jgi:Uncharacterized protein conserved in bacteria
MAFLSILTRRLLTGAALACAASVAAAADAYPTRSIEWVVPYAPGGGTDIVARVLAKNMESQLGQTMVIMNKPGAATAIGAEAVARAAADGYTVLSADTATLAANPFIYPKLSYDPAKDFDAVGLTVRFPMILVVNPSVPAKNLDELVKWAKEENGAHYATPGPGSPHHLATELFRDLTKLSLSHVPYKGAAPAVQDVVAGQVPMMFVDTASGQQFIASGRLRPIGIASLERVEGFSDIPTLDEQGLKSFEAYAWQGLVVPKGSPAAAIEKLNEALRKALAAPEVKERLKALGLQATPSSPAEMDAYAERERAKWGPVIKSAGIKAD